MLDFQFKAYSELSVNEFHDIIQLRLKVFVVEQDCPYQDLDGRDKKCYHMICRNGLGNVVGTLRILPPGLAFEEVGIGRVVLDETARGENHGHLLMEEAMKFIKAEFGEVAVKLSGQKHLEKFYNKHTFNSTGKEYLEDGIPHVEMVFKPSV